jgi:5S rRNA maturation endonuclease (ribonuclease M5)
MRASLTDSLTDFIHKLNKETESLVVVEGPRDQRALRTSGFKGEIFMLCHHQNIRTLEDRAQRFKKIILLLDGDNEGKKLAQRVIRILGGKIDLFYRRKLLPASKGRIRHVEELATFAELITQNEKL